MDALTWRIVVKVANATANPKANIKAAKMNRGPICLDSLQNIHPGTSYINALFTQSPILVLGRLSQARTGVFELRHGKDVDSVSESAVDCSC